MSNVVARRYTALNNLIRTTPDFGLDIVEGSLSMSCSWESHPTGNLVIKSIPDREIGKYRSHFSNIGKEFDIYGYRVVIDSYSETKDTIEGPGIEQPISVYDIGVNLVGKWQEKVNCPIFIRTRSAINNVSIASTVSLSSLARKEGINYIGYNHEITVPSSSGNGFSLTFENSVRENLRVNKCFLDYSGNAVVAKDWRSGNTWNFTRNEILGSVESSRQKPVFYKRTLLQGKDGILALTKSSVDKELRKNIFNDDPMVLKPPVTRTLEEGDVAVQGIPQDTRADSMPSDVKTLQSMDLNFDLSGPRKTIRQTTTVNNKVMKEVVKQYGFAYQMKDALNPQYLALDAPEDTPKFLLSNPQEYWTQIEEQVTSYIYRPINGTMEIEAEDQITKKKFKVKYVDETGKNVRTSFSKRYLTEVITQGWKLGRFQTETENSDTDSIVIDEELADPGILDLDRRYYELQKESIRFQRFPLRTIKSYLLVDPQEYYDKVEDVPFETRKVTRGDLGFKTSVNDELIIATPSREYVYPMMVMAETSQTHSFATMPNPENVYVRDARRTIINDPTLTEAQKEEDLRLEKLLAELTTGEDSFSVVKRTILPSKNTNKRIPKNDKIEDDVYVEYSYGASNQDQNFKNSLQNIKYTETFGRPGGAEVFPDIYVRRSELTNNKDKELENTKKPVYYLNSADAPLGCSTEGSVSVNTSVLSDAIATAKLELVLKNFLSTSEENMQLAFLHSAIRPGDYINSVDSFTKRRKRVKSVSFNLDYNGYVEGIGKFVTCNGTSVSLGIFDETLGAKVGVQKEFENSADGLKISANINIREETLGEAPLFVNLRTRRNR
jgi:hypothetical protein